MVDTALVDELVNDSVLHTVADDALIELVVDTIVDTSMIDSIGSVTD